ASVGESDLAPVSHAMLPLIGAGEAELGGTVMPGAEAMRRAGIKQVALRPKDGSALVSANSASLGTGALVLHDARIVLQAQRAAMALSLEGFRGSLDPFAPRPAKVRAGPGPRGAAGAGPFELPLLPQRAWRGAGGAGKRYGRAGAGAEWRRRQSGGAGRG